MFIPALPIVDKKVETTEMSINRWMKKKWHLYKEILFSYKRNEIIGICKVWMNLESIMQRKGKKPDTGINSLNAW